MHFLMSRTPFLRGVTAFGRWHRSAEFQCFSGNTQADRTDWHGANFQLPFSNAGPAAILHTARLVDLPCRPIGTKSAMPTERLKYLSWIQT
jgi:hypothetical protein